MDLSQLLEQAKRAIDAIAERDDAPFQDVVDAINGLGKHGRAQLDHANKRRQEAASRLRNPPFNE